MAVYLMGVDIGTSSCKTALFTPDGTAAASGGCDWPVRYPRKGWAEQDPRDWWKGVCRAVREMIAESGVDPSDIAGIGVDGQSWSAIALDAAGEVLCPTPIWTDTRSTEICRETERRLGKEEIFSICGNPAQPGNPSEHQAKSFLGVFLQYHRHSPGGGSLHSADRLDLESHGRCGGDEPVQLLRRDQCPEAEPGPNLIS